jgi:ribosome-binding ATPase YchF (GTP1/OBG family)
MLLVSKDGSLNDSLILRIAEEITNKYYRTDPMAVRRWGEQGRHHTYKDTISTIKKLAISVNLDEIKFFEDYAKWLCVVLQSRGISQDVIKTHTKILIEIFELEKSKLEKEKERSDEEIKSMEKYLRYLYQALNTIENFENHVDNKTKKS